MSLRTFALFLLFLTLSLITSVQIHERNQEQAEMRRAADAMASEVTTRPAGALVLPGEIGSARLV